MPNPWDSDPIVSPAQGPVYGIPRMPSPQTQPQAQKDVLEVTRAEQQINAQPLQNENTRVNIEQGRKTIANTNFDNVNNLRKQFEAEAAVQDYKTVVPLMDNAFKLGPNKAGDLNLVYAFGKVMDPNSVVREGEQVMATNVGGISEKVKGYIDQINGGAGLTPTQRFQLTEEIRHRAHSLAQTYGQRRSFYEDYAKRNNINPEDVVGPNPFQPFAQDEASYIRAHGGTPKIAGVPIDQPIGSTAPKAGEFGGQQDPRLSELSDQQKAAYQAFWGANPDPSPDQLQQFLNGIGVPGKLANADKIIADHKAGRGLSSDVQTQPDITDARGQGGLLEGVDAVVRGAADTPSFGVADKIAAAGDTLLHPDTSFQQNLARQYAISDYDAAHNAGARIGGQIAGGFLVPFGEVSSVPQLAAKGAGVGAAYGVGSSRSIADIPQNALMGGIAGAVIPTALVGAGRGIGAAAGAVGRAANRGAAEIPALVDPVTGELNQPMDAMSAAARAGAMRDAGISNVSPGMAGGRSARVIEQGLNNLPGSAGVMEDFNSAASKQVRGAMQGVAQKFGTSKTLNEGGSELQRGVKEWMTRFDGTTSKAYNSIPISKQAPASLTNTKATLEQLGGKLEGNPALQEEIRDPALLRYLAAINEHGLNWEDLKDFRTFVGNKIGQFRLSEDARTGDYRSLYAALSEDMRTSAVAHGPQAVRAFDRANTIYREGQQRIDQALSRVLGPDTQGSPEKAAAAVQAMTKGGKSTGDLSKLAQIRASTVKSGAWDEIASTLIHLGGQPANSEGRTFDPKVFVNWYADMAEPARRLLFKPEQRKALDGFVAMSQQLSRVKGMTNSSNTTPTMIGSGVVGASGILAVSHPAALLLPIGGGVVNLGMAKAWTNPTFVNIITGYSRAAAAGNENAVRSQVGRLTKLATTNPELRGAIQSMLAKLSNDNAPQMGQMAASPDQGPQNQAQPQ